MITKDGLKLVDFDWCGKEGEVRYPTNISSEIEWPEGVEGEGKIMITHDMVWFERLTDSSL